MAVLHYWTDPEDPELVLDYWMYFPGGPWPVRRWVLVNTEVDGREIDFWWPDEDPDIIGTRSDRDLLARLAGFRT